MTAAEWLTGTDPLPMLEAVWGKASARKFRLLGANCCRLSRVLRPGRADLALLDMAERNADGALTRFEYDHALRNYLAYARGHPIARKDPGDEAAYYTRAAVIAAADVGDAYTHAKWVLENIGWATRDAAPAGATRAELPGLCRCVFGNPFRRAAVDPRWLSGAVVGLAEGIYADRAFDRLPILADALEEAGCDDADVLAHCRGPKPHARGCWVVDVVLGLK